MNNDVLKINVTEPNGEKENIECMSAIIMSVNVTEDKYTGEILINSSRAMGVRNSEVHVMLLGLLEHIADINEGLVHTIYNHFVERRAGGDDSE